MTNEVENLTTDINKRKGASARKLPYIKMRYAYVVTNLVKIPAAVTPPHTAGTTVSPGARIRRQRLFPSIRPFSHIQSATEVSKPGSRHSTSTCKRHPTYHGVFRNSKQRHKPCVLVIQYSNAGKNFDASTAFAIGEYSDSFANPLENQVHPVP